MLEIRKDAFLDYKMEFFESSKLYNFSKGLTNDFYQKFKVLSSSSFDENKAKINNDWCCT